jgi:hypothetical protein
MRSHFSREIEIIHQLGEEVLELEADVLNACDVGVELDW